MISRRTIVTVSLAMASVCWLGLYYLASAFPPDIGARVLFVCLLFLAVTFTSAPLFLAVHRRLARSARDEARRQGAVWREAGMLGLLAGLCVWLRFMRVLNWVNALLLIAVLMLTEMLLLARE